MRPLLSFPCSISIPYSPPSRRFLSHEVMSQRVPQLGYMCYFDETRATKEIEANVSSSCARLSLIFSSSS